MLVFKNLEKRTANCNFCGELNVEGLKASISTEELEDGKIDHVDICINCINKLSNLIQTS